MKLFQNIPLAAVTYLSIITAHVAVLSCKLEHQNPESGYQQWLVSLMPPNPCANSIFLPTNADECNGLLFHWTIDKSKSKIHIAVAVKAEGWAGIGFSEVGGMKGADIVYYEVSSGEIQDSYVGDYYGKPTVDNSQDWTLENGQVTNDGYIIFEANRALFTNAGDEDVAIIDDSNVLVLDHRIIGAWGDSPYISYHGNNRVKSSIQLFSCEELPAGDGHSNFQKEMSERAEGFATLQLSNYAIPTSKTTYHSECFSMSRLISSGLYKDKNSAPYLIGLEYIIDPSTVKYVHHIVLVGHENGICGLQGRIPISAWAPGDRFILFPKGLGFLVGNAPTSNAMSFQLEYHFNNPDGDANQIDNLSGVKLFHTYQSVENQVGTITFADSVVNYIGNPIGNGKTKHEYTCPSECTNERFKTVDEVTIMMEWHHMHQQGKRIVTEVLRDGETVNEAATNYWDFQQNGIPAIRQLPYKLKKGDIFRVTCYYESYTDTNYGLESSDEMCLIYAYYYPRQENFKYCGPAGQFGSYEQCTTTFEQTSLDSASNFDRPVTSPNIPSHAPSYPPSLEPSNKPSSISILESSDHPSVPLNSPHYLTSLESSNKQPSLTLERLDQLSAPFNSPLHIPSQATSYLPLFELITIIIMIIIFVVRVI